MPGSNPPEPSPLASPSLQRTLTASSLPTSPARPSSSASNVVRSQIGYHKPTSVWLRSSITSDSSGQRITLSALDFATSTATSSTSNLLAGSGEKHLTVDPLTLADLRPKSRPRLKSYASSPSLRSSAISSSVQTPSSSLDCSDIGMCVDLKQHGEYPPVQTNSLSSSPDTNKINSRTFIAPGIDLTFQELVEAQNITLYDQEAQAVRFGDLFRDRKIVAIFIRHFLCPFCADYMRAIVREVRPSVLSRSNVGLIVVSHGSPHMIKSYRSIFKLPYPVYTDPSRKIYRALSMTLRTLNGGPKSERGEYLEHNLTLGLARVAKNAVKARMPLYRYPGDFFQVGGEFVLGPGLQCSYVSRMFNTASHAPIREIIKAAGIDLDIPPTNWAKTREEELERIRQRKGLRRGLHTPLPHDMQDVPSAQTETEETEPLETLDAIRYLLDASRGIYP